MPWRDPPSSLTYFCIMHKRTTVSKASLLPLIIFSSFAVRFIILDPFHCSVLSLGFLLPSFKHLIRKASLYCRHCIQSYTTLNIEKSCFYEGFFDNNLVI